jgi:hypothetical protein
MEGGAQEIAAPSELQAHLNHLLFTLLYALCLLIFKPLASKHVKKECSFFCASSFLS